MAVGHGRMALALSIAKTVLWAIIAIALVKFAFFPSQTVDETDALNPSGEYGQMTVTPQRADISNTVKLQGTIEADPAKEARATLDGQATYFYVSNGAQVSSGDPLVELRKEMQGEERQERDAEGNVTVIPGETWYKYETVHAPADGTLDMTVLEGQQFAIGDVVARIQPPTFSAVASLSPEQMYRFQEVPEKATITIKDGPAPFECQGMRIETAKASGDNKTGGSTDTSGASIRAICAIPGDQRVFPGLQVGFELVAGSVEDVLTLPVSAVEGRFRTGFVYLPGADPLSPEKVAVTLGLTDGRRVQIVEGIGEDQEVLEFIPNRKQEELDQMYGGGMGTDMGVDMGDGGTVEESTTEGQ